MHLKLDYLSHHHIIAVGRGDLLTRVSALMNHSTARWSHFSVSLYKTNIQARETSVIASVGYALRPLGNGDARRDSRV